MQKGNVVKQCSNVESLLVQFQIRFSNLLSAFQIYPYKGKVTQLHELVSFEFLLTMKGDMSASPINECLAFLPCFCLASPSAAVDRLAQTKENNLHFNQLITGPALRRAL